MSIAFSPTTVEAAGYKLTPFGTNPPVPVVDRVLRLSENPQALPFYRLSHGEQQLDYSSVY